MVSGLSEHDVTTLLHMLHSEALENRFWDRTVEGSYPEQVTTGWDENRSITDSNVMETKPIKQENIADTEKLQEISILLEAAERDLEISKDHLIQTIKQYMDLIESEISYTISIQDIRGVVESCQGAFNPDLEEDWEKNYGVNQAATIG
eukprot:Protomagalhaensia_sp_Gyna_25__3971@NODE_3576_length_527_cov_5_674180_g3021_i0_p1_GENE_NODE_3576_length_527_cov_5_674180_g3021_i0NODE_3576_length_527_cov_5_674180_g3021_i0_p1_ORF_typecomplete_len149_score30_13_NODE_3576_length_527_cov_5_674180_g3021_i024470